MNWYKIENRANNYFSPDQIDQNNSGVVRLAASHAATTQMHQDLIDQYKDLGNFYNQAYWDYTTPYANSRRVLDAAPMDRSDARNLDLLTGERHWQIMQDDAMGRVDGLTPEEAKIGTTFTGWNALPANLSAKSGSHASILAYLQAAAQEFRDMMENPMTAHLHGEHWSRVERVLAHHPELMHTFQNILRGEYNTTQSDLAKVNSDDSVRLYRGMSVKPEHEHHLPKLIQDAMHDIKNSEQPVHFQNIPMRLQPISSFSAYPDTAVHGFSGRSGEIGLVNYVDVPKNRILSTPFSGRGSKSESEYTVLGGDNLVGNVAALSGRHDWKDDHINKIKGISK